MRLMLAVVVWAAAIAGAAEVSNVVAGSIHNKSATTASVPTGSTTTTTTPTSSPPAFDVSSVKPTDRRSLFVGSNFHKVLVVAQHHLGAKANVETARLGPGELQLLLVANGGRQTAVTIDVKGDYNASAAGDLSGSAQVFYLAQLGANVPSTLAKRLAAHAHVPVSHLNYMLVATDPGAQEFAWRVYPSEPTGVYFRAAGANSTIQELGGKRTITIK
jgi:hypothetical protein